VCVCVCVWPPVKQFHAPAQAIQRPNSFAQRLQQPAAEHVSDGSAPLTRHASLSVVTCRETARRSLSLLPLIYELNLRGAIDLELSFAIRFLYESRNDLPIIASNYRNWFSVGTVFQDIARNRSPKPDKIKRTNQSRSKTNAKIHQH